MLLALNFYIFEEKLYGTGLCLPGAKLISYR